MGGNRKCEICGVREKHRDGFFANFPLDEYRCRTWVKLVGKEDLVHLPIEKLHSTRHVCGDHFEKKYFTGKRLKKRAIPTLQLTAAPLNDEILKEFPLHIGSQKIGIQTLPSTSEESAFDMQIAQVEIEPAASTSGHSPLEMQIANESSPKKHKGTKVEDTVRTRENILQKVDDAESSPKKHKGTKVEDTVRTRKNILQKVDDTVEIEPAPSTSGLSTLEMQRANESSPKKHEGTKVEGAVTPRKKKLMEQLNKTKCTLSSLKKSAMLIDNLESDVLKAVLQDALKNQGRNQKGHRWSSKNKISALAIYKRSAKTYKYLSTVIPLPSIKTLQNLLKKIPITTGNNQAVINHLRKIAKGKTEKENTCIVMFDEVSLKPCLIYNQTLDQVEGFEDFGNNDRNDKVADKALVFMVQGLFKKFKQPLGFYFVKGTVSSQKLASIIKMTIKAIEETGFRVICTVCDQGPTNMGALKILTGEKNYFYTNKKTKTFTLYDIPHLFKSIRNNFLNNGKMSYNGKVAKWEHFIKVEEKNQSLLRLSKITKIHVQPKFKSKMRVKYAAQMLSMTVSAVLKLLSEAENDENVAKELMDTALVVEDLDCLFDFTNGPSCDQDIKKDRRQNVSKKTDHLNKWTEFRRKLADTKFLKTDGTEARNVKCVHGYIKSLSALQDIWHEVSKLGFKYLNLRQLNQDSLENLFGLVRQHSPTNKNPTCTSFVAAIKTSIISGLTASHNRNSNCEKDNQVLLTSFHDLVFENENFSDLNIINEENYENEMDEIYDNIPVISIPELPEQLQDIETDLTEIDQQSLVYVSGYIAATLKSHKCSICKQLLINTASNNDSIYSYISLREWWKDRESLTYPSIQLWRTLETALKVFEQEILGNNKFYECNIHKLCVTLFMGSCDWTWFNCEEHCDSIINIIFVRLSQLLIRRQCYRINQLYRLQEDK